MHTFLCRLVAIGVAILALACGWLLEPGREEIRGLQAGGHFAATIEPLRGLIETAPDDPELNHLYGLALLRTQRPELAIWPLRKAALDPDRSVEDGLLLARALLGGGSPDDAVHAAQRVLEIEPDRVDALRLLIEARGAALQNEEVLVDAERLLALEPDDVGARFSRLVALLNLDRAEEAEQALADLSAAVQETEGQFEWQPRLCAATATFMKEKGDPDAAESLWSQCLEQFPAEPVVVFSGIEFFYERSQPQRAMDALRRAHEAEPTHPAFIEALAKRLAASGKEAEAEAVLTAATEDGVNEPAAWMWLSDYHEQRGEVEKARDALAEGLKRTREPPVTLMAAYLDLLIRAGDYDRAETFSEALESDSVIAILLRGRLLLGRGQPAEALQAFEAGLRLWPDNSVARWLTGQAAEQLGDYERAQQEYVEATRNDPANRDALLSLLHLLEAFGRYGEATSFIARYERERPRDPEILLLKIRFGSRAGRPEQVARAARQLSEMPGQRGVLAAEMAAIQAGNAGPGAGVAAIRSANLDLTRPRNGPALHALVGYLLALGAQAEALAAVDAALAAHPDQVLFHELRGHVLRVRGDVDAAERSLERALALEPESAPALAELAMIASDRGDPEAGIVFLDRAADADPENPAYPWEAILLAAASGEHEEVERRLEAMLARHGTHAGAATLLAQHLMERDPDRAFTLALRAVRLRGGPDALDTLGRIQLARGEAERAATLLGQAVELRPESASTRYWLGMALSASGDEEGARRALRAAIGGDPFPEESQARAELARLDGS